MSDEHDLAVHLENQDYRKEVDVLRFRLATLEQETTELRESDKLLREIVAQRDQEIEQLSRANQEHIANQAHLSGVHQVLQLRYGAITAKIREMAAQL